MKNRSLFARFVVIVALVIPLASCSAFDRLRALRVIKDAHGQYQRGDYAAAAELYE